MSSYEFHFGSLYNLQVLCGLAPTVAGRNKSKDDLLNDIHRMAKELDRTPTQKDLKYFDDVANLRKYADVFGTWRNAVIEAGLDPVSKIYYSSNNERCLSIYELNFTNMLEKFSIRFNKEVYYKNYINTNKRYRFDYKLQTNSKNIFVEIFGITNNKEYNKKITDKIRLCNKHNLILIDLYPSDFDTRNLNKLYDMLKGKLKKNGINIIDLFYK